MPPELDVPPDPGAPPVLDVPPVAAAVPPELDVPPVLEAPPELGVPPVPEPPDALASGEPEPDELLLQARATHAVIPKAATALGRIAIERNR
jgi:hypothetical protein